MIALVGSLALAGDLPVARLSAEEPPTERERDAEARLDDRACPAAFGAVPVGLGRLCARRPVDGAALAGLMGLEITGAATLPSAGIPVDAAVRAGFTSIGLDTFDGWLRHHRRYTPPETLGELAGAPFRPEVLKETGVWLGATVFTATALTTIFVYDAANGGEPPRFFQGRPNLLGAEPPAGVGWPLGFGLTGFHVAHIAVSEEVVFRGMLQSSLSRALGRTGGLVVSNLAFTALHATNWATADEGDRAFAFVAGPLLVGGGGFLMGALYQGYGYRLSHPVAVHFWYDFALFGLGLALAPQDNPYAMRVSFPL